MQLSGFTQSLIYRLLNTDESRLAFFVRKTVLSKSTAFIS